MFFDGSEPEVCTRCGFDSSFWQRSDTALVFGMLGYWWRHATAGISDEDLNRRPRPEVWSALEYGLHSAIVIPILLDGIERILAEDGCHAPDPCPEVDTEDATRPLTLDPASILDPLEVEGNAMASLVDSHRDGWDHVGSMDDGRNWQAEATLFHTIHDTTHHMLDVAEGLAAIGAAAPTQHALVESLEGSGVGGEGLAIRQGRGRPFEAVFLRSSEAIAPGSMANTSDGATLAVSAVDWTTLRPGTRVQAGTAQLELSYPVNAVERRAGRSDHRADGDDERLEPAGWYAWIRRPGLIRVGSEVVVSPSF